MMSADTSLQEQVVFHVSHMKKYFRPDLMSADTSLSKMNGTLSFKEQTNDTEYHECLVHSIRFTAVKQIIVTYKGIFIFEPIMHVDEKVVITMVYTIQKKGWHASLYCS